MNGKMKISVLDGHTLNPGDLSWDRLKALGECEIFPRSTPPEVLSRSSPAKVIITNKVVISESLLSALPLLEMIAVSATGYNVVDVAAATARGVVVCNVPIYGTDSVAQMAMAHLLNLTQRVADHAASVRGGRWVEASDWCFWDYPLLELRDKILGIIGFGRIGQATARMAQAFGMRVIAVTRDGNRLPGRNDIDVVDLDTLFRTADVISLHCPLTPETSGIVSRRRLALMKPQALLINTSRGALVDEQALAEALNEGRLGGVGLDVIGEEPPTEDQPLFHAKNCYVTPHIGWATLTARRRLLETTVDNVAAFVAGQPQNVVNG